MFYVLNFETHQFISCDNANAVEATVRQLLADGMNKSSLEIVNGYPDDSRLSVDEFRSYCEEYNLVDERFVNEQTEKTSVQNDHVQPVEAATTVNYLCEEYENDDGIREFRILAVSRDEDLLRQLMKTKINNDEYGMIAENGVYYSDDDHFSSNFNNGFVEYYIATEEILSRTKLQKMIEEEANQVADLSNVKHLNDFDIPALMTELEQNAWYGRKPTELYLTAGDHVIGLNGYTYEPSYECFSTTSSISLDGKILYGLDSRTVEAYRCETYHTGIYEKFEDALAHVKDVVKELPVTMSEKEPAVPDDLDTRIREAQKRSTVRSKSDPGEKKKERVRDCCE